MRDVITDKPHGDNDQLHTDHLLSHVKEGHITGSLIYNALMSDIAIKEQLPFISADFWSFKHIIIRSVRKYLKGELLGINRK